MAADLRPDLVLLDLAMPVMDGLTVLPEILRVAPGTQVMVLSACGTDRMVHVAIEPGATAFVQMGAELADELAGVLHETVRAGQASSHARRPA
ncbi:MAG TPA: response regulator [Acidimicrobiales bacterium]|nr:response regulator [Acidimicrobiales bacterium]